MEESSAMVQTSVSYTAKKAFFSFLGNTFRMYDSKGGLAFYIKQKAFKLKEDIRVYRDEGQSDHCLTIKARSITDFRGAYDITDSCGAALGGARREGMKSLFKDSWVIFDASGEDIGKVQETGGLMIFIRKFFKFIPQKYEVTIGSQEVGQVHQRFNPFQLVYDCTFSGGIDPRHGVGLVVLLLAIEGGRD